MYKEIHLRNWLQSSTNVYWLGTTTLGRSLRVSRTNFLCGIQGDLENTFFWQKPIINFVSNLGKIVRNHLDWRDHTMIHLFWSSPLIFTLGYVKVAVAVLCKKMRKIYCIQFTILSIHSYNYVNKSRPIFHCIKAQIRETPNFGYQWQYTFFFK